MTTDPLADCAALPLQEIRTDAGMMGIFHRIGCIGDSLASGEFECFLRADAGETMRYWDNYAYSWGKCIERVSGIRMSNYSRGGLTACQLYTEADQRSSPVPAINELFSTDHLQQAYILALGVNDRQEPAFHQEYQGELGRAGTDIDRQDYRRNRGTFIGWYAKIIQRLQSLQPDAKFFLVTLPREDGTEYGIAERLRETAACLKNCFLVDLFAYAPVYDAAFHGKYFSGGHMNAMGYQLTACYFMSYIDWIIRRNPQQFRNVPFIGEEYSPFEK